jgi:hypothetical protein
VSDSHKLLFDGRTLKVTVIADVRSVLEYMSSGRLVHQAARGPLLRMAFGSSQDATEGERKELGELLANYDNQPRTAICVKHTFIVNTDEDMEVVSLRLKGALDAAKMRCMVILGECDPVEAAPLWRTAIESVGRHAGRV